jgi:hypothetical protein
LGEPLKVANKRKENRLFSVIVTGARNRSQFFEPSRTIRRAGEHFRIGFEELITDLGVD